MNIKNYFDKEMNLTVIFSAAGIIAGYISFLLNNPAASFILMLLVAGAVMESTKRLFKIKEEFRWWLGNGIIVYAFLWLVTWTIFYNVALR